MWTELYRFLISAILFFSVSFVMAQGCPSNEADLANGGTFSGNCTVNVGGSITITGAVIWTSGRLTINGGDGDMYINSGGSVTIQDGATLDMDDGDITIESGGVMVINSGGSVEILDNDRELYVDGGTLTVSGTLSIDTDMEVDNGGTVTFASGSVTNIGDDFKVEGGSTINVEAGSQVTMDDRMDLIDSDMVIAGTIESTGVSDLNLEGSSTLTMEDGGEATFNDMEFGTGDGVTQFIMNGGAFNLLGEVDFNGGTDGDAIVINGGVLDVGNDLEIGSTDGTITVNPGGTVNAPSIDDVVIDDPDDLPSNIIISGGNFNIGGYALPVELISFEGSLYESQQAALLEWTTATEINNRGFFIEKSEDGKTFESLGFVDGNGTATDLHEYSFLDYNLRLSSYYRLRQVDFDGEFEYSKIIFLSVISSDTPNPIKLFPNPTQAKINVDGLIDEVYNIQIRDVSGKLLFEGEAMSLSDSERLINQSLAISTNGILFVRFSNPGYTRVIRVVKQ